ncbi:MAG: hypothetical protein LBS60_10265 [Deltaproteobacteria bacterium]|nr:hypothetical protein [Deltaproteobacteria bacterium]
MKLFKEIKAGKFKPYTSVFVVEELENTPDDLKRNKMLDLISKYNIIIFPESDNAINLANLYIDNDIIPLKKFIDAIHIAIASINNLDKIISLNFGHIVRDKTKIFTDYINKINGYKTIEINSPLEVIDHEEI